MKIKEIITKIDNICPPDIQEEWDNSGIQLSYDDMDVKRILVALEVTEDIVDEAIEKDIDLIVTHHPLFFGGFKSITEEYLPTKYAIKLIENHIAVHSCHTNFDIMDGGNNDYLGSLLDIKNIKADGIIRSGRLKKAITLNDFGIEISKKLEIDPSKIRLVGNPEAVVKSITWCTGAGADYIMDAYDLKSDAFITGDIKYHEARTAYEFGINILDIGHYGSEIIFTKNMASILNKVLSGVEIIESESEEDPFNTL